MSKTNDYNTLAAGRQQRIQKNEMLSHVYVEKPMMSAMLPSLTGKKVLMVGCGTGEETLLLEKFGATMLTGIDISETSIELANQTYPQHTFRVGEMHHLDFPDGEFDFVYSSLTIHYSMDPLSVYQEMFRVLKPGGQLLFSVGHPMRWASEVIQLDEIETSIHGYSLNKEHPRVYGTYHTFRQIEAKFHTGELLTFWVGAPSMHFQLLKKAGFHIEDFQESKAIDAVKEVHQYYYDRFSEFPQFVAFLALK